MRFRRSLFVRLMLTYICILGFALSGGIFINYQYTELIRTQTERYNEVTLRQAQTVLDEKFAAMEKKLFDTSFSVAVNNFLYTRSTQNEKYFYNMHLVAKELSGMSLNTDILQDFAPLNIYLYHAESDTIVDGNSKYDTEYFFSQVVNYADLTLEEWKEQQFQGVRGTRFSNQRIISQGNEQEVITCANTLPVTPARSKLGGLGIIANAESFRTILESGIVNQEGAAFILDKTGNIFLKAGDHFDGLDLEKVFNSEMGVVESENNEFIATRIPSSAGDFTYLSLVPTSIYMSQINRLRVITAITLSIMLLSGLFLSQLFAKKNTSPIKHLVSLLQKNTQGREFQPTQNNEIDYIGEIALSVMEENRTVKKRMEDYLPSLQNSFLTQFLRGDQADPEKTLISLKSAGIYLGKERYCVIVLNITDSKERIDDMNLMKFSALNVIQEMLSLIGEAYTINMDIDYTSFLIGSNLQETFFLEKIQKQLGQASEFIEKHLNIYLRFGIGSAVPLKDSSRSFREAQNACDFSLYEPINNIVQYQNIQFSSKIYSYPMETEMQLISCVKNGNKNRVLEIVSQVISENYADSKLSPDLARCLFFDIMSTAIKIMSEMSLSYKDAFTNDPILLLTACKNIVEMEQILTDIFIVICDKVTEKRVSHNEQLKNTILEYIDKNFMNSELSLSTLASVFHLSPAYVSRFLKEYAGINFVDYLRTKRVEKSVFYLKNDNISIHDIAERVGYTSSIVFIRNFKKLYGITPGEMRLKS